MQSAISCAGGRLLRRNFRLQGQIHVNQSKRILGLCLLAALALGIGGAFLKGQEGDSPGSKRRIKIIGKPNYPDLAKKMNLSGVVKVEVTIGADGKVKRTRI